MSTHLIVLYIAVSVDGYIASRDGSVDWLEEYQGDTDEEEGADSYEAFFKSIDCLVMGARTYEQVLNFGDWPYEDKPTYVFTSRDHPRANKAVKFYDGTLEALATRLRQKFGRVWLVGGAELAQSFLHERQVDELRLNVVPVILGKGIPLFAANAETQDLQLLTTKTYETGITELHYRITE